MASHEDSKYSELLKKLGFKPYIPKPQTEAENAKRIAAVAEAKRTMSAEENERWEMRDKAFQAVPWFFTSFDDTITIAMDEHRNKWKASGAMDLCSLGFSDLTNLILIDKEKGTPTLQ